MTEPGLGTDKVTCCYCDEVVNQEAMKCRHCGEFLDEELRQARLEESGLSTRSAFCRGLAAVLSTVWPGLGQIFQGRLAMGFIIMLAMFGIVGMAITSTWMMFSVAFVVYVGNIFDAYNFGIISRFQEIHTYATETVEKPEPNRSPTA